MTAEANAASKTGTGRAAFSLYDEAIEIRAALPLSAANRNSVAINLQNKGSLLCRIGQPSEGIEALDRALHIREGLCAEKGGHNFREDLGYSLYNLAKAVLAVGDTERAARIAKRLVRLRSEMADDNGTEDTKRRLANALSLKAHLLDIVGDAKGAMATAVDTVLTVLPLVVERGRNDITPQLEAHLNVFGMIFGKTGLGKRDVDPALVDDVRKLFEHPAASAFDGHPEFMSCLNDYAMALVRLKRFREAESNLNRLLASDKRRFGAVSREVAMKLHNLGICHFGANSLARAEHYFTAAADVFTSSKANSGYYAGSICMLAELCSKSGREDQALRLFSRANDILRSEQGFEREQIMALTGLAHLLEKRRSVPEALEALKAAHTTSCGVNGRLALETGRIADLLCLLLARAGRPVEAIAWFDEALRCAETHLGVESETVRKIRQDFAPLLIEAGQEAHAKGDSANAEHYFARAIDISRAVADAAVEATALTNFGLMQRTNGKAEAAAETLKRALALNRQVLGPEHPNTLMCWNLYGITLACVGRAMEALKCFEEGLLLAERACGIDSPEARYLRQNREQCLADLRNR